MKWMLSRLHRLALRADRALTHSIRLPAPVLSVGNLAMGGRAKTPFVIEIARFLKAEGRLPVVLTRGYGRRNKDPFWLVDKGDAGNLSAEDVGDEALEIFWRAECVVLVGSKRASNALSYYRSCPKMKQAKLVFILDDGFQHWHLQRDFDLVLVEAADRQDKVFPLGYLREEASALERAHKVLERGADFEKKTFLRSPPARDVKVAALTTRAPDPGYRSDLEALSPQIEWHSLADHAERALVLAEMAKSTAGAFVLGGKEAVKLLGKKDLEPFFRDGFVPVHFAKRILKLHYAECGLEIRERGALFAALKERLNL